MKREESDASLQGEVEDAGTLKVETGNMRDGGKKRELRLYRGGRRVRVGVDTSAMQVRSKV